MIIDSIFSTSFRVAAQLLLNLQPTERVALPAPRPGHKYMLYSHVPFCESLCPYCSFNRFIYNEKSGRSYFASLRDEMRMVADRGYDFEFTLHWRRDTHGDARMSCPRRSIWPRELFHIREVSCETNPNHLDDRLVDALAERVQRLSVGVQSFDDALLKQINRYDRFGSGEATLERIHQVAGKFASMNVDMIFNFPGQDEAALRRDIELIVASGANQTTFYPLMTSPSVRRSLSAHRRAGGIQPRGRVLRADRAGAVPPVRAFDAWTFSRKGGGLIDEYIVESEEYVGIGSGSFSYLNGSLYVNTFSLDTYRQFISERKAPITGKRRFVKMDQMRYRFMMDLFGLHLDKRAWKERFGRSVERTLPLEMAFFQASGAIAENTPDAITLTPHGRYMLVVMMREFFAGINRIRDQARQAVLEAEDGKANDVRPYSTAKA